MQINLFIKNEESENFSEKINYGNKNKCRKMIPKAIHINIINAFTAKFIEKLTDIFGQSNLFFDDLKVKIN
jgi:hypothetical protein